ncbi:MAG: NAD(P)/FAD-dependent oxidoreductase [Pseudomonadota bacterium]|uniref:phytoene desaturase family protein n=1 Tax=Phenylobacterium sp. TaxID=1871053 RepID=UPI0025F86E08|nr:NAD(P)/FAD-dependent oxidoreductase [Phenylobacterium sp.]MBT9471120.1 NAD(P)/FAD-dependent oxidoreductase [Phenylobacterium sp.]
MARSAYDAIVIGAGHNGLTLATRLSRAGLSTLVLEAEAKVGGMSRTDAAPHAGFLHNPHANLLSFIELMPLGDALAGAGLRTVWPRAQHGVAFADGRPPLILHRPDARDLTIASLARYSPRDAATFGALTRAIDETGELLAQGMFAPAHRDWFVRQAQTLQAIAGPLGVSQNLGARSARAIIDELFETPELRTLLYQLAVEFGVSLEDPGGDLGFLGVSLWIAGRWRVPIGGMQSVPNALQKLARANGAEIALGTRVAAIELAGGRAIGVRTARGEQIVARRLVASSIGPAPTLLGLVGADRLSPAETASLGAFAAAAPTTLASLVFCLRAPPAYHSARWDPEINHCLHTVIGFETPDDVLEQVHGVQLGCLPEPGAAVRVNSLWDPSQAPAGFHVAGADILLPPPGELNEREWRVVRDNYADVFLQRWGAYAPGMSPANVLASEALLAGDYERAMRFREGTAQYRTEIDGLYLCGASTYPGGGVHGACGHNAFTTIAEDLALIDAG